ncbi:MAG: glycosyl hydrolase [Clostridia bacterium]|nr:glycosyl hydrolase [Clostridia bacterium]
MKWFSSTENEKWLERTDITNDAAEELKIGEEIAPPIYGFGGCFNEIGMQAIETLREEKQNEIFDLLFSDKGLSFCYNRISIGANDFAEDWYSYNDHKGDYAMEHFSIERDRKHIIPAIKKAQERCPDMMFFASPWSPPTWMKYPQACNYGRLVESDENLRAYALYFRKFLEEYAKEGIQISHLHPQNEFLCDHKFPSCQYSAEEMENFMANYLIDEVEGLCEVWLGTNCWWQNYMQIYGAILQNEKIRKAVKGAGFQWSATSEIQMFREDYPDLAAVHTECECGDGRNTWDHAMHVFELYRRSARGGASANVYWNMVLPEGGLSTWGWRQNSLFTIKDGEYTLTPEFYCVKHFAQFVKKGARMLRTEGSHSSNAAVFKNADGSTVAVIMNPYKGEKKLKIGENTFALAPRSFNTIIL